MWGHKKAFLNVKDSRLQLQAVLSNRRGQGIEMIGDGSESFLTSALVEGVL